MYLGTLFIVLNLDPEVILSHRARILRSLREKLKQKLSHRVTITIDEKESSLAVAFFDDNFERLKSRIEDIYELVESAGEARVRSQQKQIFSLFNGHFVEISTGLEQNDRDGETIVYGDLDADDLEFPVQSRFSRKSLRIPTRK